MCVTPPGECQPQTTAVIHQRNVDLDTNSRRRWMISGRCAACACVITLVLSVGLASPAAAAPQVVALAASLTDVLNNIRDWLVGLLASLATLFFTVGGVRYLAADGDPGEVGKAKQAFKSAALGYGLAALAPILVEILKGIVGAE
jgi:hypothetical protein